MYDWPEIAWANDALWAALAERLRVVLFAPEDMLLVAGSPSLRRTTIDQLASTLLPGYAAMGENGMAEHADHTAMGHMKGPPNTLPMMMGQGPFGNHFPLILQK